MKTRTIVLFALLPALFACGPGENPAPVPRGGGDAGLPAGYDAGLDFLRRAATDGNFRDPGLTALAAGAFLSRPGGVREDDRGFVDGLLSYVAGFQKEDGGIYDKGLANYTTCAAVMALTSTGTGEYGEAVEKAAAFLKTLQTESGGIGYSDKHPGDADLSNTQFAIESLRAAGLEPNDQVFSKALQFLQRVQNRSESNDFRYEMEGGRIVTAMDDGGAFYKPGESKAGLVELPDGRLAFRSYGSMTYALLKCYLLAGLPGDDPRVEATVKWIRNHYTLEENPGFDEAKAPGAAQQGLFYYYFTMAKALDLLGVDSITDADGLERAWRKELREKLASLQQEDGSWVNEKADRWMEGNPVLATCYALSALSYCAD